MANNDRIYGAYMGEMGETFRRQTRERIDWIVEQAHNARTVLDIGCSQGIVSLLLGEQGKEVEGIDIQPENIAFAKDLLKREYAGLSGRVKFVCQDFMEYRKHARFDAILITEVLEHLEDPLSFLNKAADHLAPNGRLVVTVPFGVNDHPDHYSTFYLLSAYRLLNKAFQVESVRFHPNWMGFTAVRPDAGTPPLALDEAVFEQEEEAFMQVHRTLTEGIRESRAYAAESSKKYAALSESYGRMKKWQEAARVKAEEAMQKYEALQEQVKARDQARVLAAAWTDKEERIQSLFEELERSRSSWQEEHRFLEELERSVRRLEQQNKYLKQENEAFRKKFALVTDTWYGRLALRFYRLLKKVKNGLRKGRK